MQKLTEALPPEDVESPARSAPSSPSDAAAMALDRDTATQKSPSDAVPLVQGARGRKRHRYARVALKFFGILGLAIVWAGSLAALRYAGIGGAIPAVAVSAPFLYGWWRLYNSEGGKIAMLLMALFFLAAVLIGVLSET